MESHDDRLATVPGVKVVKLGYSSQDGVSQIRVLLWTPEKAASSPKAIVQITHGMEEHIGRYVRFANVLASHGFVVCGYDMVGHGLTAPDKEQLGCLPLKNGKDILIQDAHELRKMIASRYSQQTPYFMFGHSMGSYLMRAYITRHAEGLAGVILSGAGHQSRLLSRGGNLLARLLAAAKGENHKSAFLESMGVGAFAKKIENARTGVDWLSVDEAVVDDFIADPLCGGMFSVGGYATLTDITGEVVSSSSASQVPRELPILFVAGDCDPVGDNGKGVEKSALLFKQAGVEQVEVKLYEGMRHEILNEPSSEDVYTDIMDWMEAVIAKG